MWRPELKARITGVTPHSIAAEMGIKPGDHLLSIDGHRVKDILDYRFYTQEDYLVMDIEKPDGEVWSLEIEKDYDEELGLVFDEFVFDRIKPCRNRCVFCFVDQLPRKMRKTLYVKDDDYRLSFLTGNFITLTNLGEKDWYKITSMRLSPLYVSVHCLRPELRVEMMGNERAAFIKDDLRRLQEAGIEVHTQVVLCPGLNDGDVLEETISGLAEFYPAVRSVGIVPVGLTGHRRKLRPLKSVDEAQARELVKIINSRQREFRRRFKTGFVYLADEFFVLSGLDFPPARYYDDYCQVENGIGLARILLDEFAALENSLPAEIAPREVCLVTGKSATGVLQIIKERLDLIKGLELEIIPVENRFFGGNVDVTGLLTGRDIIGTLGKMKATNVVLPAVLLKDGSNLLLDDTSIEDIARETGACIYVTDGSALSLIEAVLGQKV